ncbi:MAG: cspA [Nevskia sp.]|nr:cspA [Nevskia sp.]
MSEHGTVRWFNYDKKFGYVIPENGNSDIYIPLKSLEASGIYSIKEGQKISFEIEEGLDKTSGNMRSSAINIKIIEP